MKKYLFIEAWGHLMGSFHDHIKHEVELATAEDAPANSIYKDGNAVWYTTDDLQSAETLKRLIKISVLIQEC